MLYEFPITHGCPGAQVSSQRNALNPPNAGDEVFKVAAPTGKSTNANAVGPICIRTVENPRGLFSL